MHDGGGARGWPRPSRSSSAVGQAARPRGPTATACCPASGGRRRPQGVAGAWDRGPVPRTGADLGFDTACWLVDAVERGSPGLEALAACPGTR
ncbi:hypothetical protein [Streptomyces thioluteus]|uniref:hypothetical protein n=1 Tax=Streptomyces thioluteus TaxID=66431 RepID=UPI003CD0AE2B